MHPYPLANVAPRTQIVRKCAGFLDEGCAVSASTIPEELQYIAAG
jgi:hypothetical protein